MPADGDSILFLEPGSEFSRHKDQVEKCVGGTLAEGRK